jgi:hypothetical protein
MKRLEPSIAGNGLSWVTSLRAYQIRHAIIKTRSQIINGNDSNHTSSQSM